MRSLFLLIAIFSIRPLKVLVKSIRVTPDEIASIISGAKAFSQHVINAEYDKIAACYTVDAKIFPSNTKIIEGREKIRQYWVLPEGVRTIAHKTMASEIKIIGDEAYDYGYYEGKTRRANGEEVSWKGKYVIIWKKIDGNWKMYLDIWNRVAN